MSSIVIRIRTPYGMLRSSFDKNLCIKDILTFITKELIKKNQIVSNPLLYLTPFNKDKSKPLNEQSKINEYNWRDGQMLEVKAGFESTIKEIPEEEKSIYDLPAIPYEIPDCALHSKGQSCVRCMVAKYIRVDRKEKSECVGISADKKAVAVFKYNLEANLAYSVQRIGILYGKKCDDGWLQIDFIYEPPQENSETDILLLENKNEMEHVEVIAEAMGCIRIGCIFGQTADDCDDEEFILTAPQILMAAEIKGDVKDFIILFAGIRDEIPFVEGYELTDQFYDLYNRRYFKQPKDDFFLQVKEPLWIQSKEEMEAEVEFFITPVPLKEYRNDFNCDFPVENRVIKQSPEFLKKLIQHNSDKSFSEILRDFHVLLFLSSFFGGPDLLNFCNQVITNDITDGNKLIINSIAGL